MRIYLKLSVLMGLLSIPAVAAAQTTTPYCWFLFKNLASRRVIPAIELGEASNSGGAITTVGWLEIIDEEYPNNNSGVPGTASNLDAAGTGWGGYAGSNGLYYCDGSWASKLDGTYQGRGGHSQATFNAACTQLATDAYNCTSDLICPLMIGPNDSTLHYVSSVGSDLSNFTNYTYAAPATGNGGCWVWMNSAGTGLYTGRGLVLVSSNGNTYNFGLRTFGWSSAGIVGKGTGAHGLIITSTNANSTVHISMKYGQNGGA